MTDNVKYENLCIDSDLSRLQEIRDYIYRASTGFGFSDKVAYNISLAVDEACSNLIKYAYNLEFDHKICISVETDNNEFNVLISDNGKPFNPLEVESPNMTEYFKKLQRGGLGIFIMKSVMDDITYYTTGERQLKNTLRLKKYLA